MVRLRSGGQTGTDRAALDWALENALPHEGWCPCGRLAEDGPIAPRYYALQETPSESYDEHTAWNVLDADATAIISLYDGLEGGSKLTIDVARSLARPLLHLSGGAHTVGELSSQLSAFLAEHRVRVLNITGPRASEEPGVGALVGAVLSAALGSRESLRPALQPKAQAALVPLWGLRPLAGASMGVISLLPGRNVIGRLEGKLPPYMAHYVRLDFDARLSNYHASIVLVEARNAHGTPMVTCESTGSNGMELIRCTSAEAVGLSRGRGGVPETACEGDILCLLPGCEHPYRLLLVAGSPLAPVASSEASRTRMNAPASANRDSGVEPARWNGTHGGKRGR